MTSSLLLPPATGLGEMDGGVLRAAMSERAPRTAVICHPVWQFGYGGMERQLAQILPLMRRTEEFRFEHVLIVRGSSTESRQPWPSNVRVVSEPAGSTDRRWWRRLAAQLREHRADMLHVRGLAMLPDAVTAARLAGGVPVAFSFHGVESTSLRLSWIRRSLIRAALRRCNARWCVSRAARQRLAELLRVTPHGLDVIENGVDTAQFHPASDSDRAAARRQLGLPRDGRVVLSVGNLKRIKGHEVLLESLTQLRCAPADCTVVLVGEDYGELNRETWRARLGRRDVRFVGLQRDVRPWLAAADVFVLPSLWEGLSNALLEAMAAGLAVVATAVGGTCDVARHGDNALLVPPGDAVSLAYAIDSALADAGLRERLGQAARKTVETSYELAGAARRISGVYRQLLAASQRWARSASSGGGGR